MGRKSRKKPMGARGRAREADLRAAFKETEFELKQVAKVPKPPCLEGGAP